MLYPATRESNPVGVGQLTGDEIDLSFDPRAKGIGIVPQARQADCRALEPFWTQ